MKLCGKEFKPEEISQIREIIAENQDISRRQLSRQVCERLNWRSANGKLKEMSCRVALLRMQRQGVIKLPPVQGRSWLDFLKGSKDKHSTAINAKAGKLESEARTSEEFGVVCCVQNPKPDTAGKSSYATRGNPYGSQSRWFLRQKMRWRARHPNHVARTPEIR